MSIRLTAPAVTATLALLLGACGDDSDFKLSPTVDASSGGDSSGLLLDATAVWDTTAGADAAVGMDASAGDVSAPRDIDVGPNVCPPVTGELVPGDPLVIPTREGPVVGVLDDGVRAWLGIPFAAPPVGELRFAAPAEPVCRTSPLVANQYRAVCPQQGEAGEIVGDEDCLTLNIWSPAEITTPLPVLVFIHGGGHMQGSAARAIAAGKPLYDGRFLARGGPAVVVTIQYRLGALGWLAHPAFAGTPGVALANRGLMDQQQALTWISTHINGFGGDPARMMLFGESAGSVDTGIHLGLPASRSLISAAILQSGTPQAAPLGRALVDGEKRVTAAGCADDTIACLRAMDATALVKALPGEFNLGDATLGGGAGADGPVVDGVLITAPPVEMISAAIDDAVHPVPVIIGTNTEEMFSLLALPVPDVAAYTNAVTLYLATPIAAVTGGDVADVAARILATYPVESYDTPRAALVDIYTDLRFTCPAIEFAEAISTAESPVYRYLFARRPDTRLGPQAAAHGIELPFVFGSWQNIPLYTPAAADQTLSEAMMNTWLSFARESAPTITTGPGTAMSWPSWQAGGKTAIWDAEITVSADPREGRCDFWRTLAARVD